MKVDIQTLGTFDRLTREGADRAAKNLGILMGSTPKVEATSIDLLTREDVIADFRGRELVGSFVQVEGLLEAQALLLFDQTGAKTLLKNLQKSNDDGERDTGGRIEEVGNILLNGFIDGWADHLNTPLVSSPPQSVSGTGTNVLPGDAFSGVNTERLIAFTSTMETTKAAVNATVYLFPKDDSFREILSREIVDGSTPIPLDKLHIFKHMMEHGTKQASENISMMTGVDTTVDVSRLSFMPIERTFTKVNDDVRVGVVFSLDGLPSGYLMILFDEQSARTVAEQMGAGEAGFEFEGMQRSAIEELANIMTSGFIDGWANVLETSITHTSPEFVHDLAPAILNQVAGPLAEEQRYVFVFDSMIQTVDRTVTCELLTLPDGDELTRALKELDVQETTQGAIDTLVTNAEANTDDVF